MTSSGLHDRHADRGGPVAIEHVWRGLALLCLTGVVWGTIGPAVHLVHEQSGLSVLMIGAYRGIAAVAALVVAVLVTSRLRACLVLARGHWRRVVAVGTATAVFQLLFFVAVVAAGVSVATVVALGSAPVLLLVATSLQRRRPPAVGHVVTVATAVVGLLLVGAAGGTDGRPTNAALGVLAALGSGAAYATSAELGAPLSRRHDPLTVAALTMTVAAAVLVSAGLGVAFVRQEATATTEPGSWLLLAYLGVVTMAFAYVLLFAGLRSAPSGSAVVATLLEPVTAVLIAVLFLDERLSAAGVVGSLLILAAIAGLGRLPESELQPQ